jgi:hypothetical protein
MTGQCEGFRTDDDWAVVHRSLTIDGLLKPPPVSLSAPEGAKKKRAA